MEQNIAAARIEEESKNLNAGERCWFDEQGNIVSREVDPEVRGPRVDDYAVKVTGPVTQSRAQELIDAYTEVTELGMTGTDRTIAIEALLEIDETGEIART